MAGRQPRGEPRGAPYRGIETCSSPGPGRGERDGPRRGRTDDSRDAANDHRAARISARWIARGPEPCRRRIPSRWSRQLVSVAVTYSAPVAARSVRRSRPMRPDTSGNSTEKTPPKPAAFVAGRREQFESGDRAQQLLGGAGSLAAPTASLGRRAPARASHDSSPAAPPCAESARRVSLRPSSRHQELGQLEGPLACAQTRRVGADPERAVVAPHRRDAARRRADHGVMAGESARGAPAPGGRPRPPGRGSRTAGRSRSARGRSPPRSRPVRVPRRWPRRPRARVGRRNRE